MKIIELLELFIISVISDTAWGTVRIVILCYSIVLTIQSQHNMLTIGS